MTPLRSGPSAFFAPSPIWWQALHLLNCALPFSTSSAEATAGAASTIAAAKTHLFIRKFLPFVRFRALERRIQAQLPYWQFLPEPALNILPHRSRYTSAFVEIAGGSGVVSGDF